MSENSDLVTGHEDAVVPQHIVKETKVISTMDFNPTCTAIKVLYAIAGEAGSTRNGRTFPPSWHMDGIVRTIKGTVTCRETTEEENLFIIIHPLTLKIGAHEGIVLRTTIERPMHRSMVPNADLVLEVGSRLSPPQVSSYAHQLIASWIVQGTYGQKKDGGSKNKNKKRSKGSRRRNGFFIGHSIT